MNWREQITKHKWSFNICKQVSTSLDIRKTQNKNALKFHIKLKRYKI